MIMQFLKRINVLNKFLCYSLIYVSSVQQEIPCKIILDKGGNALGRMSRYQSCQVNMEAGCFGELTVILLFFDFKMQWT